MVHFSYQSLIIVTIVICLSTFAYVFRYNLPILPSVIRKYRMWTKKSTVIGNGGTQINEIVNTNINKKTKKKEEKKKRRS